MDFISSISFPNEPLVSWTFLGRWVGLLLHPPKSDDKNVQEMFNWSQVHSENEIGTLESEPLLLRVGGVGFKGLYTTFKKFSFVPGKVKVHPWVPSCVTDQMQWWRKVKKSIIVTLRNQKLTRALRRIFGFSHNYCSWKIIFCTWHGQGF